MGEAHFFKAKPISSIQSTKPIAVNRLGFALALIKAKPNGTFAVHVSIRVVRFFGLISFFYNELN